MREWKKPPKDPDKLWVHTSLEVTCLLACNWNCCACDQLSNYPSIYFIKKGLMTVSQIEHFAKEMRDNNAYFGRLRVVGGEPTTHPKLLEISEILAELVNEGHAGHLEMVSNGSNPDAIQKVRHLYKRIRISDDNDKQATHTSNAVSPRILGYRGKRCSAPFTCGITLCIYGYFPCSGGAGIARLEDRVTQWQRLSLPKKPPLEEWPDLEDDLCQGCQYALVPADKVKCGTRNHELNAPHPEKWKHLAPWLNGKKPEWKMYGASANS